MDEIRQIELRRRAYHFDLYGGFMLVFPVLHGLFMMVKSATAIDAGIWWKLFCWYAVFILTLLYVALGMRVRTKLKKLEELYRGRKPSWFGLYEWFHIYLFAVASFYVLIHDIDRVL